MVIGSQNTQKEPWQWQGEYANLTQEGPSKLVDSNPRPSCFEVTLLTTFFFKQKGLEDSKGSLKVVILLQEYIFFEIW